jgi:hypothetical protein
MMNPKDAPYFIGLIIGIMIGYLGLRALGVTGTLQFLGAIAVGIAIALVAERLHAKQ